MTATKVHPIDQTIETMADANPSTAGQVQAADFGCKAWDAQLNKVYHQVLGVLSGHEQEVLRAAQRAWIEFRDAEFKLIETIYGKLEGTMYIPMQVYARMNITKSRALQLEHSLEELGIEIHEAEQG